VLAKLALRISPAAVLFAAGACLIPPGCAQTAEPPSQTGSPLKRLPAHIWEDQKAVWTSPFHANRQDAKWWAVFGGATAALIATDEWTSQQLANTKNQISIGNAASRFGSLYALAPATAGLYFFGTKRHDGHLRETGLIAMEALADAAVVDQALKIATQRERPREGTGEGRFWQGSGRLWNAGSSFPSGHEIETWTMASVIAHEYPRPRIIPIAMYTYALGIGAARFVARAHFASDIVAGAAMGWFIGDFVYHKRHDTTLDAREPAWKRVLAHVHVGGIE
jgi:membrane-associated phospholipid phosphatase